MQVLSKFLPYMGGRSWLWPVGYCIELGNACPFQFVTLGMGGRFWMWGGVGYSIKLVCALCPVTLHGWSWMWKVSILHWTRYRDYHHMYSLCSCHLWMSQWPFDFTIILFICNLQQRSYITVLQIICGFVGLNLFHHFFAEEALDRHVMYLTEHPTVQMWPEHHGIWIWYLTVQCWSLWLWNPHLRAEFMGEFVDDEGILRLQWSRPLLRLVGDWVEVCQVCCPFSMFLLYSLSVPTPDWQVFCGFYFKPCQASITMCVKFEHVNIWARRHENTPELWKHYRNFLSVFKDTLYPS